MQLKLSVRLIYSYLKPLGTIAMFRFYIHLCQVVGALSHWDTARPQGPYPSSGHTIDVSGLIDPCD